MNKDCKYSFENGNTFETVLKSTQLYALPGKIVNVNIPSNLVGKVEVSLDGVKFEGTPLNILLYCNKFHKIFEMISSSFMWGPKLIILLQTKIRPSG